MIIASATYAKIADYICKDETEAKKQEIFRELRTANINDYNERYPYDLIKLDDAIKMLDEYAPAQFKSDIQALKSMDCWKYNSDRDSPIYKRISCFLAENYKPGDRNTAEYDSAKSAKKEQL
jgi:hypothetical protein